MNGIVSVRNVAIGEGTPKICVPMVGETTIQLIGEAELLRGLDPDIIEWRADFYEDVMNMDKVIETMQKIRIILEDKPIIFTLRSAEEGGKKEIEDEYYLKLNLSALETGLIDIIDVELFRNEGIIGKLVDAAHNNNIAVIISNHDFQSTPPKEEIISRLLRASELGGDIPKIAVMPNTPEDVLTLLDATRIVKEEHGDKPIITMSMGVKGIISRLSGEIFGSAITFGAAKKSSAPGQIPVEDLRMIIGLLHDKMKES